MERDFLKKIIEQECGELIIVEYSAKPEWLILKKAKGYKTFAFFKTREKGDNY